MEDPFDVTGKVALVTGSSRGIGAELVRHLARHGGHCIINFVRDPEGQNQAEAEALARETGAVSIVPCDVGEPEQVAAMFAQIGREQKRLDILINNAGILRERTLKRMTAADWDPVIRTNLTGAFHCLRSALPLMPAGGRIVNVSSVLAFIGLFSTANYAASKAGLIALTKTAARELALQKITVNAIAPGFVETDMTRTMPSDAVRQIMDLIPLGHFADPADVAHATMFLCSKSAAYITGQTLHVNGGLLME
jgi:3-oxoacyl-[acyl-carrier protein] reductase